MDEKHAAPVVEARNEIDLKAAYMPAVAFSRNLKAKLEDSKHLPTLIDAAQSDSLMQGNPFTGEQLTRWKTLAQGITCEEFNRLCEGFEVVSQSLTSAANQTELLEPYELLKHFSLLHAQQLKSNSNLTGPESREQKTAPAETPPRETKTQPSEPSKKFIEALREKRAGDTNITAATAFAAVPFFTGNQLKRWQREVGQESLASFLQKYDAYYAEMKSDAPDIRAQWYRDFHAKHELMRSLEKKEKAFNQNVKENCDDLVKTVGMKDHAFFEDITDPAAKSAKLYPLVHEILSKREQDLATRNRGLRWGAVVATLVVGGASFGGELALGVGAGVGFGILACAICLVIFHGEGHDYAFSEDETQGHSGVILVNREVYRSRVSADAMLTALESQALGQEITEDLSRPFSGRQRERSWDIEKESEEKSEEEQSTVQAADKTDDLTTPLLAAQHSVELSAERSSAAATTEVVEKEKKVEKKAEKKMRAVDSFFTALEKMDTAPKGSLSLANAVTQPNLMGNVPFTGERLKRWKSEVGDETCDSFGQQNTAFTKRRDELFPIGTTPESASKFNLLRIGISFKAFISRRLVFESLHKEQLTFNDNLKTLLDSPSLKDNPTLRDLEPEQKRAKLALLIDEVISEHNEALSARRQRSLAFVGTACLGTGVATGLTSNDIMKGVGFSALVLVVSVIAICIYHACHSSEELTWADEASIAEKLDADPKISPLDRSM